MFLRQSPREYKLFQSGNVFIRRCRAHRRQRGHFVITVLIRGWRLRTGFCSNFTNDCAVVKFVSHPHSIICNNKVVEVICLIPESCLNGFLPRLPCIISGIGNDNVLD
ncbi:hypothetical protein MTO96_016381 [Rhipicephalus appendiculatus]